MRAADTPAWDTPAERLPGQFARHAKTGAPIVTHPTETTKHTGNKADLIALCAAAGIVVPKNATVHHLHTLLGSRPKKVMYGRPSSLGKQIENMTNIQKWSERAVALGLWLELRAILAQVTDAFAQFDGGVGRGNLHELAITDPTDLDDADAKTVLDRVAVRAKHTAQAALAADRGTHHHGLTEDHDNERDWIESAQRGEDLGVPTVVQAALVAAWGKMLAEFDIEILAVEATCVDDLWRQAGTLDRICRLRKPLTFITVTGEYVTLPAGWVGILDIKTGKLRLDRSGFVSYWHGYSVQLASYAHAVPYDPDTDLRGEWPWPIDQQWAVIAHLDVLAALDGEAVCRLVLVDLVAGRHAGAMCVAARQWEARTDVFSIPTDDLAVRVPVDPFAVSSPDTSTTPLRAGSCEPPTDGPRAVDEGDDTAFSVAPGDAASASPVEQPPAGAVPSVAAPAAPSKLQRAQAERARIDREADAKRRLHTVPEEGTMSTVSTFAAVQNRYARLDKAAQAWVKHLSAEAEAAGVGFSAKCSPECNIHHEDCPAKTARRFELLVALTTLARDKWTDSQVRGLLYFVIGDVAMFASVPLGHIVGSLTATEAATFAGLACERLAASYDDDGRPVVAEVAA